MDKNTWMLIAKVYYRSFCKALFICQITDGDKIIIGFPKLPELKITNL